MAISTYVATGSLQRTNNLMRLIVYKAEGYQVFSSRIDFARAHLDSKITKLSITPLRMTKSGNKSIRTGIGC